MRKSFYKQTATFQETQIIIVRKILCVYLDIRKQSKKENVTDRHRAVFSPFFTDSNCV